MLDGIVPPLIVAFASALLLGGRRAYAARRGDPGWRGYLAVAIGVVCVTALLESAMGRPATYRSGPVRLWVADVNSDQNSQQVSAGCRDSR